MDRSASGLALVTGASSGIGFELAKQCASHGFDVVAVAEDERLVAAADAIGAAGASSVLPVRADLSTADGVRTAANAVKATGRDLDALVLNAGVGVGGAFIETPLEDDLRLVDLNVVSLVHLAKLLVPAMAARGRGRVLITASIASTMPGPYYATYAASKSFALSFAEAIRFELADRGVTVTALMPGPTDTDFFRRAGMEDTRVGQGSKDDPADVAADGFAAMMDGKDHVVAGSFKNAVQTVAAKAMPDKAKAAMHARLTEPHGGGT
jgi:short-subunit dehydrogenase